MRDDAIATMRIFWYGVLAVLFVLGVIVIGWKMWPTQMAVERDVMQQSHQYTDAKKLMLLKMVEEYETGEADIARYRASDPVKFKDVIKGMEAQQESILVRMRAEAKMIPLSQVPDSVHKYVYLEQRR